MNFNTLVNSIKVRRLSDVLGSMIDYTTANTTQINDFTPGSIIRSIYEAFSMTIEEFYIQSAENTLWGIQHGVLDAFGFSPREAMPASGPVTITLYNVSNTDTTVYRGTTFYSGTGTNKETYVTREDYVIPANNISADVIVYCTVPGTEGNVGAHQINKISTTMTNIASIDNEQAFTTGSDEESTESEQKRFQEFVDTRGRSTIKAMEYAARTVPEITGVYIYEQTAFVSVFCHDANGDLPDDVRQKVKVAEENYRPAGIGWDVYPVNKISQDLDIEVDLTDNAYLTLDFLPGLSNAISNYLNTFTVGQDLVLSDIINKVVSYSPYIYDVHIMNLTENVSVNPDQIIRAGNVDAELTGGDI